MMVSNINVYNVYTCILCFLVSVYLYTLYTCLWCCKVEATGRTEGVWWRQSAAVETVQCSGDCTGLTYQHVTPGRTAEGQERTLGQLQHLITSPGYFSILWERERPSLVDQVCSFAKFQCPDDIRWSGLQASNL